MILYRESNCVRGYLYRFGYYYKGLLLLFSFIATVVFLAAVRQVHLLVSPLAVKFLIVGSGNVQVIESTRFGLGGNTALNR